MEKRSLVETREIALFVGLVTWQAGGDATDLQDDNHCGFGLVDDDLELVV